MQVISALVIALFFATALERILTAIFPNGLPFFSTHPKLSKHPVMVWITMALGVLICYLVGLNLVEPLLEGLPGADSYPLRGLVGIILTGLAIGGGSNLVHDLFENARYSRKTSKFLSDNADAALEYEREQYGDDETEPFGYDPDGRPLDLVERDEQAIVVAKPDVVGNIHARDANGAVATTRPNDDSLHG